MSPHQKSNTKLKDKQKTEKKKLITTISKDVNLSLYKEFIQTNSKGNNNIKSIYNCFTNIYCSPIKCSVQKRHINCLELYKEKPKLSDLINANKNRRIAGRGGSSL